MSAAGAYELAVEASRVLAERTGVARHDVAVVLGSGWSPAADLIGDPAHRLQASELPGFRVPRVPGHGAEVRSVPVGGHHVLVCLGRVHGYEGHDVHTVVHAVRTAVLAGCRIVVLTNAVGAVAPEFAVGEPVLIRDHINLTGRSPLTGPNPDELGPRFPDMTDAYAPRLRSLARRLAPDLREGVYAGLPGPQYETPAEITMLRTLGADLVGMSTVHETIAAVHLGAEVLGLSLVTNLAAGLAPLVDHGEIVTVASASARRMGELLGELVLAL